MASLFCKKSSSIHICDLPSEVLILIASQLDYKTLCRLGQTCRLMQHVSKDDSLWKLQCAKEFLLTILEPVPLEEEESWFALFRSYHYRYGRHHSPAVYRTIRRLWNRLEKYLAHNDPDILEALREPCCLGEIQICEQVMGCKFPADLRCSLQIHNGQQMSGRIGMCGCMQISTYFRSEGLVDAAGMARHYNTASDLPGCVPLTYCYMSQKSQYIGVSDVGGFNVGEIFYDTVDHETSKVDIFISAKSFTEWLTDLVETLENKSFTRINDKIYRFLDDPECVARTSDCFEVQARTCFMPDLSTINPPHYFFIYRITMSMDSDSDADLACQLETRHWVITDEDGNEEHVDGPGVVGEYPVMRPGESFSWISCTTFSTTYGNMRGSFTMKNLITDEEVEIMCPTFHMKCLPYTTWADREKQLLRRKKDL